MPRLPEKTETDSYDPSPVQGSLALLQMGWKRKPLIALGTVLGLLVGWVYYLQRPPVYESTAQIKVEKTFPSGPIQPDLGTLPMYEDYLATQMEIIKGPRIVRAAVKAGELNKLASFAGQDDGSITTAIRSSLTVSRVMNQGSSSPTNIVNLAYRGGNSDDCEMVLQQLIASYEQYLSQFRKDTSSQSFSELNELHTKTMQEKAAKESALRQLLTTHKIVRTKDGGTLEQEILTTILNSRASVETRGAIAKKRLEALEAVIARGEDPTPLLELSRETGKNFLEAEASLEEILGPLRIQESVLLQQYGADYYKVKEVRAEMKAKTEEWERRHSLSPRPVNPNAKKASPEVVDFYLKSLRAEVLLDQLSEKALQELADKQSKSVVETSGVTEEERMLRNEIEDKRDTARTYRRAMDAVKLGQDHGGIVSETHAEPGKGYQVDPKPTPILLASLLGGLLLGVGLAWLAEITDQSFRNPEDIRRRLRVQVLGHVPRIEPTEEETKKAEAGLLPMDPSICAYYFPKSVDAEAFRGLRTTLFFKLEGEGHKVIQVTSPNMGDGKTTLATNLAVSIAQSGKRILLIDADFRRPRLHKMFGLDVMTGLASVIAEETDLQEAIQPCVVPNLFMLPCGPRPNNPAELLTSQRFLDLLAILRKQFDIILIDTPPLLAVSDPSVVAPRVDGVLLTIRVARNGRPAAERAGEILRNLSANVYGVVVNGIDGGGAQEGYGASQYGYSYNYAYGYTYEGSDNNSYYHDADADVPVHETNGTNGVNGKASRNGYKRGRKSESGGLIRWIRHALWR